MKKLLALAIAAAMLLVPMAAAAKSELAHLGTVEVIEREHEFTHEEVSKIVNDAAKAEIEAKKNGQAIYTPQVSENLNGEKNETYKTLRDFFANKTAR